MKKVSSRFLLAAAVIVTLGAYSSAQTKYFPPNAFASEAGSDKFISAWYSQQLRGLAEPSLFEETANGKQESYRFLWLRTFHHPIAVRIEFSADGTSEITWKECDGAGGYSPGKLIVDQHKTLSIEQTRTVQSKIAAMKFWSMPSKDPKVPGDDGSEWVIEGAKEGKYHAISRWTPSAGAVHDFGLFLVFDLAGLKAPQKDIY